MGSPAEAEDHEEDETLHQVTISQPFYLGKYEVTQAQWRAVMGDNPSFFRNCGDTCPVEGMSWEEVETFIAELNARTGETTYRLPTEAEWEYAARAGTQTTYHFGDAESELCRYANHADSSTGLRWRNTTCSDGVADEPAPVGSYQPNQWGLYDMHGNVWEWVADWYGEYPAGPVTDPQGPATGSSRVGRGGGWRSTAPRVGWSIASAMSRATATSASASAWQERFHSLISTPQRRSAAGPSGSLPERIVALGRMQRGGDPLKSPQPDGGPIDAPPDIL